MKVGIPGDKHEFPKPTFIEDFTAAKSRSRMSFVIYVNFRVGLGNLHRLEHAPKLFPTL